MDLNEITDVLNDPTAVEQPRLTEVHGQLADRIGQLRPRLQDRTATDEEIAEAAGLRDAWTAVNGEVTGRTERAEAREAQLDEASGWFADTEAAAGGQGGQGGTDTAEQPTEGADVPAGDATPVAAAANPAPPARGATARAAGDRNATGDDARRITPSVAIVAAGEQRTRARNDRMEFNQIGEALSDELRTLRTNGGDGSNMPVVRLVASGVPEDRHLRRNQMGQNTGKLDAVASPGALVAAGGLCAPLAIDYSYQTIGVQGRPIRDALPGFQAERGGIQFRPDVSPAVDSSSTGPKSATGVWTNADDENAYASSNAPRKAVWYVDCPDTATAEVEAITLQLEFSNVSSRFDPETVQANQAAALIWHDRFAENRLLGKLQANSKVMTSAQVLGATRDMLVTLDRAQAYYRSVHRLGNNVQLRAIMPFWVCHLIRSDLARSMSLDPMQALAITDDQIANLLRTRNLNPVWHLDGSAADAVAAPPVPAVPAQQYALRSAGDAIPNFPTKVDMLLHTEGHFTFLDGGTLDLGIVRDSDLIDHNRYRQFSETWEGVAARGVEALRLIASVAPTGETAGAIDVTASQ